MLFEINKQGNLFAQDSSFMLVEEFKKLYRTHEQGADWLRWIVLVYDYDSPYRQLPMEERMRNASRSVFGATFVPIKPLNNPLVAEAITKYKELQYDPILEQYDLYMEKIHFFNIFIRDQKPVDAKEIIDLQKVMENSKGITDIALELRRKVTEVARRSKHIRGGVKKSVLEAELNNTMKELEKDGLLGESDGKALEH